VLKHKIISDDPIDFGAITRRRVRILVPRGTGIDRKEARDLAFAVKKAVWDRHGEQIALAVIFYDDIFDPAGTLGSWDYCPNGVWGDAVDDPSSQQRWVLERSSKEAWDIVATLRRRSRDGGNVDNR
jgi:hypothetical protein